ncbi:hypothetical protein SO802_019791 [Lithocarpus litseifolius]|uniref:Uncharacterized protein n=1 Tax=Lithocarpus litseifolius TaxID=425828 RepID=A0AAW2CRS5_9ROSI
MKNTSLFSVDESNFNLAPRSSPLPMIVMEEEKEEEDVYDDYDGAILFIDYGHDDESGIYYNESFEDVVDDDFDDSCTVRLREGEETPYGEWLRAGFRRPKFQQTRAPPTPSRRDQEDSSVRDPTPSGHTPEMPPVRHVINGIDEGVTDLQPAFNTHEKLSVSGQDVSENGHDFMMHTEFNGIQHNPENHGERLISVPISYVDVERKDSKTLANTCTGEPRDTKQKPNEKTRKFKKIPRPEHDTTSKPAVSEGLVRKK